MRPTLPSHPTGRPRSVDHDETLLAVDATAYDLAQATSEVVSTPEDGGSFDAAFACHPDDMLCELAEASAGLEDYMLTPNTPVFKSAKLGCAQMFHPSGPQWQRSAPTMHELAVRNDAEEIYMVFKLWLAPQNVPWCASARRLIVTHAGVPLPFRRRGILSSTMDKLIEIFSPDEVEIDSVLSDHMRAYAEKNGYTLIPANGNDPTLKKAPSYRLERPNVPESRASVTGVVDHGVQLTRGEKPWSEPSMTLVDALRRVPEAAMRSRSMDAVGPGGRKHYASVLGRADSLESLATPGLLMLVEICLALDSHAAVDTLRSNGWQPSVDLQTSAGARALLAQWAARKQQETARWLEKRAHRPPAELPLHRVRDAVSLAEEAHATLEHTLQTLAAYEESPTPSYAPALGGGGRPAAIFTSEVCLGHDPGLLGPHPERPERLSGLLEAMRGSWLADFGDQLSVRELDVDATEEQISRVHSKAHRAILDAAFSSVRQSRLPVSLDADTVVSPGTEAAALRAAGLTVAAVDAVFARDTHTQVRRAFVMARPPGHHAEPDKPGGFCLYNNVMVGVAHAEAVYGAQRIAVLDFDVHHGNGDSAMVWDRPDRLYASSHESPLYPGTGAIPGRDGTFGQILSAPLRPGGGSDEFRDVWQNVLLPAVREFNPDAVFLSAGFDAHKHDPSSSIKLHEDDFAWITTEVCQLGNGNLPIVSVLEGGYDVSPAHGLVYHDSLTRSVRAHLLALLGE